MKYNIYILLALICLSGCLSKGEEQTQHKKLPSGQTLTQEMIDNNLQKTITDMVFIKGGTFMMGDVGGSDGYPWTIWKDNKPPHIVTLDSYYIGKFEITYAEHDIYTTVNNLKATNDYFIGEDWRKPEVSAGVSWYGAEGYCTWLGEQTGLPFALPTEAQWEYAARNRGEHIGFATDNGKQEEGRNIRKERGGDDNPHPPAEYPPNPLGIYAMTDNVSDWVQDWYDPDYYKNSPELNPTGPATGLKKVYRGGGYYQSRTGNTVYLREKHKPELEYSSKGFRCAIQSSEPPEVLFKKLSKHLRPE